MESLNGVVFLPASICLGLEFLPRNGFSCSLSTVLRYQTKANV